MNDNPISSSTISVQMAYDNYLKNKYIVNRKKVAEYVAMQCYGC